MLKVIKKQLEQLIQDIDCGNSNLTESEEIEVINFVKQFCRKDEGMSRNQAASWLRWSLAKFDRYVKSGELPKGKKVLGFSELRWFEKDLIEYVKTHDNKTKNKNTNI